MSDFLERTTEVASELKAKLDRGTKVRINTHTDPDGVSAGGILTRCLNHYDIPFHISFGGQPDRENLEKLGNSEYDFFVFLDQGTGQFDLIEELLLEKDKTVAILDHHPGSVESDSNLIFLNPHEFELNGSNEISASGVVYEVVKNFADRFSPLSELALIGAVGDRQEHSKGFVGVNEVILDQALEDGFLGSKRGIKLTGRSKSLLNSVFRSINPFLPGLSGNMERCEELVEECGHDPDVSLEDLDEKDERKLFETIISELEVSPTDQLKNSLWGNLYVLKSGQTAGPKYIHDYVEMLIACEKLDKVSLGFSSLLGDDEGGHEALESMGDYADNMLKVLLSIESGEENIRDTSTVKYVNLDAKVGSRMVGEIASVIVESGLVKPEKPVLVLAQSGDSGLKISARGTRECVERGIDLGKVMSEAAKEFGGSGGGHDVAAAARIPMGMRKEFIGKVNRILEE